MESPPDLLCRVTALKTEAELSDFLRDVVADFDLKGFMVINIPAALDEKLSPRIVLSDLPEGFLHEYDELGLLKNSPVFEGLRRSTAPVMWSTKVASLGRPPEEVDGALQIFARHGLSMSVYFPVHGTLGRRAVVGFLGNRPLLSRNELGELGIVVMHAYDVYSKLKAQTESASASLTARELEILHWASCGKTSMEIAAITSLSDHTINSYMTSAMRKLDCVNRTHLVAKALRLHLIS
ncbi:hypothetical protein AWJ14_08925 [Hoeflea olei]|uniref:HTH luxR-type domain-containing protein n=2 Tax=Hoeflea olei TaxID=1480615 RepID=A0A1C1Z076_9HYPH|nr:hypothetical protein AWJ14_08925 [Hoeflea olei]